MKNLFLLIIAFVFCGALTAQNKGETKLKAKPAATKEKSVSKEAGVKEEGVNNYGKAKPAEAKEKHNKFECPQCHMTAEKPGKCSMCKVDMIEAKAEMKKEKAEMKEHKHDGHDHNHGHDHGHGHDKKADEKKAE